MVLTNVRAKIRDHGAVSCTVVELRAFLKNFKAINGPWLFQGTGKKRVLINRADLAYRIERDIESYNRGEWRPESEEADDEDDGTD